MSVHRYPGDFRIGVLNERRDGVLEPGPSQVQSKLMVLMLLSGWQKFRIEDWRIELDARQLPDAVMLRISEPCEMEYLFNWGQPLVKISLAMPIDWLDRLPDRQISLFGPKPRSLEVQQFVPSEAMRQMADVVVASQTPLERMAFGMQLLDRCVAGLTDTAPTGLTVLSREPAQDPLARLRKLIAASPKGHHRNAAELAREMGMGLRSLERLVHEETKTSLGALIRKERMKGAVIALHKGASISQAASLAGYTRAANFSAAIRRYYGCSPRDLKPSLRH